MKIAIGKEHVVSLPLVFLSRFLLKTSRGIHAWFSLGIATFPTPYAKPAHSTPRLSCPSSSPFRPPSKNEKKKSKKKFLKRLRSLNHAWSVKSFLNSCSNSIAGTIFPSSKVFGILQAHREPSHRKGKSTGGLGLLSWSSPKRPSQCEGWCRQTTQRGWRCGVSRLPCAETR